MMAIDYYVLCVGGTYVAIMCKCLRGDVEPHGQVQYLL